MEGEIRQTIYALIVDILKSYVFPTNSSSYEETINEFINQLCMQNPNVKEQLLIEKNKYYEDINQVIVGCIYVIAQDTKEGSLKTADIMKGIQKVNHVLEQMNLVMNRQTILDEDTKPLL